MSQTLDAVTADERFVIHGVDWKTYEKFLDAVGERHVFLTYDGENLEFMSPSHLHELYKEILALLVRIVAARLKMGVRGFGSATWRKEAVKRGLEADSCFYIKNVKAILGKAHLDLRIDPPPDLAIEIDITRSHLDRQSIYAKLGVPEIWQYDGELLQVFCLNKKLVYELVDRSPTFPLLDLTQVPDLMSDVLFLDDTVKMHRLRRWVHAHIPQPARKGKKKQ